MIALVVTMIVEPQNQAAFEAAIGELTAATRANEPGVLLYQLCKAQDDQTCYRLLEIYESQDVLDSHMSSAWFKAAGPRIVPLVSGRATIVQHDTVG